MKNLHFDEKRKKDPNFFFGGGGGYNQIQTAALKKKNADFYLTASEPDTVLLTADTLDLRI